MIRNKSACIVAAGVWDGSRCLMKTRDRNYKPRLKAIHEIRDGVEVLYIHDTGTGWTEGLNEHGIGVVNSALMVGRDESEKKIIKTVGKKSKDGARILKTLEKKTLDAAIDAACSFKGGIRGHTFVSDADTTKSVEQTSKHECVVKTVSRSKIHVRTNHGFAYEDAGYTEGEDYVSSVYRRDRSQKILRETEKVEDIAPALYDKRKNKGEANSVVRDTDNMRTTSQLILDLTNRTALLYLLPGKMAWEGVDNRLPKGYKPKLSLEVFKYNRGKPVRQKLGSTPSASRVATRFATRQLGKSLPETGYDLRRVNIFRAVPASVDSFKPMDYVGRNLRWVKDHANHVAAVSGEEAIVIKAMVMAADVYEAYNPGEYFYDGPEVKGRVVYRQKYASRTTTLRG